MSDEYQNDHMDEDEEEKFKTPLVQKKKKKKQLESETENHDDGETMDIRVKQISEKPDRVPPIVAYFSSGYDPCAEARESEDGESPSVTVYRHAYKQKRLEFVVSPPGANVEFVGSTHTNKTETKKACMYRLGVLDKVTKTLRILPIVEDKVFRLEPRVKIKEAVNAESPEGEVIEVTVQQKTYKLNSQFGTKKANNRDKKRLALNPEDDPEAQKFLDGKLNEADVKTSALVNTNTNVQRDDIPPYNDSATDPSQAYPIEKIIENGEWHFLQDVYKLLQQGNGAPTDSYPLFVRNRFNKLRAIQDEREKEMVCGVLTLLTHLVKFKDSHSMIGLDSAKDHRFPGVIRQKCQSLFKDSELNKIIPADKLVKLITYILVLALHVDDFKTDPRDIAKDLRMSVIDLRKYFELLGCKPRQENKIMLMTLPVPLKFAETRHKRRR